MKKKKERKKKNQVKYAVWSVDCCTDHSIVSRLKKKPGSDDRKGAHVLKTEHTIVVEEFYSLTI